MKKSLATLAIGIAVSAPAFAVDLDGAKGFEPEKFLGTWYQIQSTNPVFQRNCKCAKAEYSTIDAKTIKVVNTCYEFDGGVSNATGKAVIGDPAKPSRLSVSFSPISFGGVNYVVTEFGENYEYAVIVTPGNAPIWILSREKELSPSVLAGIHLRLVQAGVKINNLKDTSPLLCESL
ncbi:MAG: lipocalin family protein [Silvanigrellaceae bacterium]